MKLELRKFDMADFKDGSTCLVCAKRGGGKSTLIGSIFKHHKDWPAGIVISPTERANHHYEQFIPKFLIYDKYDRDILARFVQRQHQITDQRNEEIKRYGRSDIDNRAFLIMDDCLYDKSWVTDPSILEIFYNGRHFAVTFIIAMQYPMGIPPHLRANLDYVFILRENVIKNRERLYNQYAGMFTTFQVFCQVMDVCTANYHMLVINNKTHSNKLTDQVFWYKADMDMNFRVCSKELWDMQAMYDEKKALGLTQEEDDEEDYNPEAFLKKGPRIKVRRAER